MISYVGCLHTACMSGARPSAGRPERQAWRPAHLGPCGLSRGATCLTLLILVRHMRYLRVANNAAISISRIRQVMP